jgi:AraC-like DNA-binding protein
MIQERILLEAQRYLYHEIKNVKEIAYDLGFDDPAYFTRFFKKHTGFAPQYFKQQKNLAPRT